jgi:hypothetical protein
MVGVVELGRSGDECVRMGGLEDGGWNSGGRIEVKGIDGSEKVVERGSGDQSSDHTKEAFDKTSDTPEWGLGLRET